MQLIWGDRYKCDAVQVTSLLVSLRNWENNETEESDFVTPTRV